jgi:adenylate cyclase
MTGLQAYLRDQGIPPDDIAAAAGDGSMALHLLAVDRVLLPQGRVYTLDDTAGRAGIDPEAARRLWRAFGFPDLAPDERAFADADIDLFKTLRWMMAEGVADFDAALQVARVTGRCLSRIAEAQVSTIRDQVEGPLLAASASDQEVTERLTEVAAQALPALESLLNRVWRRHLFAAAERAAAARYDLSGRDETLTVGFADLVGFTETSERLEEIELAHLIGRFESIAFDTCASHGARVIKIIGDEVMFVTGDPAAAALVALDVVEACAADDLVPDVRVGLAHGTVLPLEGDYFGPTVNVAARLVEQSRPAAILVSDDTYQVLQDTPGLDWRKVRPKRLKGIGRVPVWALRRARSVEDDHRPDEPADAAAPPNAAG